MAENKSENANSVGAEAVNKVIEEIAGSVRGIERQVAGFKISFDEDNGIVAQAADGFTARIPMLALAGEPAISKTWYFLATWIAKWDDTAMRAVEGYLGYILYPAGMALSFDEQYVNDLKASTEAAMRRELEHAASAEEEDINTNEHNENS